MFPLSSRQDNAKKHCHGYHRAQDGNPPPTVEEAIYGALSPVVLVIRRRGDRRQSGIFNITVADVGDLLEHIQIRPFLTGKHEAFPGFCLTAW